MKKAISRAAKQLAGLAVLSALFTGCVTTQPAAVGRLGSDTVAPPPLADLFWSLNRQPNKLGKNDCSNKAGRYFRALREQGYAADIVVVSVPPERRRNTELHAVVKVGDQLYCDPTFGTWSRDLKDFGAYRFTLRYDSVEKLPQQFL